MDRLLKNLAPKRVVLNFLRIRRGRPTPVRVLIAVSEVFGFTANATRVAIARLSKEGMIESDERGLYRLTDNGLSIARHLEEWRLGEERLREWDGTWLAVALPGKPTARNDRKRSLLAMEYMGLREGLELIWVRPNNLVETMGATTAKLYAVGLERRAEPFVAEYFRSSLTSRWKRSLWARDKRDRRYRDMLERLSVSRSRVESVTMREGLVESFLMFADGVRMLARDPLLPEEIASGELRRRLTHELLGYESMIQSIWTEFIRNVMHGDSSDVRSAEVALGQEAG